MQTKELQKTYNWQWLAIDLYTAAVTVRARHAMRGRTVSEQHVCIVT